MINMYNEDLSNRITNISRNMIKNISTVVGKEFEKLLQHDKEIIDYEIERKRQYDEITLNLQVDEKVCEFIVEMAASLPHDKDIKHYTPKGDTVDMDQKDINNQIDPDCVGTCTKCSLLHFVNVRYPMNKAMHMLMEEPTVHVKYTDDNVCAKVPTNLISNDYDSEGFSESDVASALLCEPDMSDRGRDARKNPIRTKILIDKIRRDLQDTQEPRKEKYTNKDITPISEHVDYASDLLSGISNKGYQSYDAEHPTKTGFEGH